jgi:hypothetical protein
MSGIAFQKDQYKRRQSATRLQRSIVETKRRETAAYAMSQNKMPLSQRGLASHKMPRHLMGRSKPNKKLLMPDSSSSNLVHPTDALYQKAEKQQSKSRLNFHQFVDDPIPTTKRWLSAFVMLPFSTSRTVLDFMLIVASVSISFGLPFMAAFKRGSTHLEGSSVSSLGAYPDRS